MPGDRIQYDYGRRILTLNGEPVELTFERRVTDDEGRYIRYTEHLDDKNHAVYLNQAGPSRQPYEWLPSEGRATSVTALTTPGALLMRMKFSVRPLVSGCTGGTCLMVPVSRVLVALINCR